VVCVVKNSATLAGSLFTLHVSQVHIDLPTLSGSDKEVISKWGAVNKIDFLSLSYTRHAKDVRDVRFFFHPFQLCNVCFVYYLFLEFLSAYSVNYVKLLIIPLFLYKCVWVVILFPCSGPGVPI
jgi:Pyruvate kinase, barrel domain